MEKLLVKWAPGSHFINVFPIICHIRWTFRVALIRILWEVLLEWSVQTQLELDNCDVENFVAHEVATNEVIEPESRWVGARKTT